MSNLAIKLFFFLLVTIVSIKYILFWTYVWQLKEYRWDRFCDFLRSREGHDAFLNKFYLAKILLIIFIFLFLLSFLELPLVLVFILAFMVLLLFLESAIFLKRVKQRKFIEPVFTSRAIIFIFIVSIICFYVLILNFIHWGGNNFVDFIYIPLSLVILIYIPLVIALVNLIISPFFRILKNKKVKEAGKIMDNFFGTVIGITGSYGKSSVKEFTFSLLENKFNILKTPKNINTEIGVANHIISQKSKVKKPALSLPKGQKSRYFICEMGAYRIGEIKKMCGMVKPKIGILTGINEQHIALFGNIENTIKGKSELINSLPSGGLAIINFDDENCRKVVVPSGIRKITYGFSEDADFRILEIRNLKLEIKIMEIIIESGGRQYTLNLNALGKHSASNLLPAIIVAREAGMDWDEIAMAVEDLKSLDNGMKIKEINGAVIIDDTYNSNPAGVRAALEVLDSVDRKHKILVLDDIWELGKEGERIHRELAKLISAKNYDKIILVGKEYAGLMKKVMVESGVDEKRIIWGEDRTLFCQDTVVLLEGRRAGKFLISNF
ncbi:MAG: UDP-N-acetylmuramoyl-tripeptide--D-alanyl-D-alanine ligase [bacterium]